MQISNWQFQFLGWVSFIISALFFLVVGILSGDWLTILGAFFFLLADIAFFIPFMRNRATN